MVNATGAKPYDVVTYTDRSGNAPPFGRRTQVYEAQLHHTTSGDAFHAAFDGRVDVPDDAMANPAGALLARKRLAAWAVSAAL